MAQLEEAVVVAGEPGQNPLDNPLILEHVFSFLPPWYLRTCRRVSKLWRAHALKTWRSNTTVALAPGNRGSKLGKFMNFVNRKYYQDSGVPYTKFSLTRNADLKNFWDICGGHINILKLSKITFRNADHFRRVVYQHCSNMRELTLQQVSVKEGGGSVAEPGAIVDLQYPQNVSLERFTTDTRTNMLGISWMELLGQLPSMKVLTLEGPNEGLRFGRLFQSALRIRQLDPTKLNLKVIHAFYKTDDNPMDRNRNLLGGGGEGKRDLARFLVESNLQLEGLSVRVCGDDYNLQLWQILGAQATTLKKLTVTSSSAYFRLKTNPPPDFLRLPNVSYLKLEEIKLDQNCTSLQFLRYAPNLKKMDLNVVSSREGDNMIRRTPTAAMGGVQLENCTDLKLVGYPAISLEDMEKLSAWLPNVKNLSMSFAVDNEMFALICSRWSELVDLEIIGFVCQVDECGFTGLDRKTVQKINAGKQVDIVLASRSGNITLLQNLQRITLRTYEKTRVLGRSAYLYGFGQLRNLQSLEIVGYEFEPADLWEPVLRYRETSM